MRVNGKRFLWLAICLFAAFWIPQKSYGAMVIWVCDSDGRLGTVDTVSGDVNVMGLLPEVMTDIAFAPNGDLYAISFNDLWKINPADATGTKVGSTGIGGGNSLVFGNDGTLYGAGSASNELFRIDTGNGYAISLGSIGVNETAAGDLAFVGDKIYWTATSGNLLEVSFSPQPSGIVVGDMGRSSVYGLASPDQSTLFGVQNNELFAINLQTAQTGPAIDFSGRGLNSVYGAAFTIQFEGIPEPSSITLVASIATCLLLRRRPRTTAKL